MSEIANTRPASTEVQHDAVRKLAMRLILVRHGETPCNVNNIWHGLHGVGRQPDMRVGECQLTERGRAQARAAAVRLRTEPIRAVYSSPLRRALQTAEEITALHGLSVREEFGLCERDAGEFDGIAMDEVRLRYPAVMRDRAADYWNWRPPGGETFREVLERVLFLVERLERIHAGETVALVSHMGVVRVLLSHIGEISLDRTYEMTFPSTSISIVSLDALGARVDVLNDATHAHRV